MYLVYQKKNQPITNKNQLTYKNLIFRLHVCQMETENASVASSKSIFITTVLHGTTYTQNVNIQNEVFSLEIQYFSITCL